MNASATIVRDRARPRLCHRNGREASAFILLEVMIALVILGVGVAALMRSFTISLEAARQAEIINTATLLAESFLDEIQVAPPAEEHVAGTFGENYPGYSFDLTTIVEEIDYRSIKRAREAKNFRELRRVHLDVYYEHPRRGRFRTVSVDSALSGITKFTEGAMQEYHLFDLY